MFTVVMKVGMLWFDDSPDRPLANKIERAAKYYEEKYGDVPNVCYVHPSCLTPQSPDQAIQVVGAPDVLPHHLWIGLADPQAKSQPRSASPA